MSSPEERILELNLDATEAHIKAVSKKYGGRISLITGTVWFGAGAFVTDCLLHIFGETEHMSNKDQYLAIAAGGLAGAATVLRHGYKQSGVNLAEIIQWRREENRAINLRRQVDELKSWVDGPSELSPGGEAEVEQFMAELNSE